MKRWYWLMLIVMSLVLSMSLVLACGDDDDDDDDDDSEGDDDFFDDDDAADDDDDDATDDDATDDDTTDDDDDDTGNPVLVDSYWDPAEFDMEATCGEESKAPCTALIWEVCDLEGDLSGGQIYAYQAGTSNPAFDGDLLWDDFLDGSDVTDCDNPYATGINVIFPGAPGDWCPEPGQFYIGVDIEVSDGAGNFSNMLTDIEVVWNCA